jgi:FtsP/CotA-like multicopper oxidase with cupredoxin domain
MLTRRGFVAGAAASALTGCVSHGRYARALGPQVEPGAGNLVSVRLDAAERPTALPCFGGATLPLWTFAEGAWPPLIRLDLGDRLEVLLRNGLPRPGEHTSIHWHGVRLPNDQDGVPYLVQRPVRPGESFRYAFTPPDTGTYFFHTHCNTIEQLGRGLEGVLIVDGDAAEPYDADEVLVLRDWRVEPGSGRFNSFTTPRGAARAGTYGPLRSVNGRVNPILVLPASGDCRLRLLNTDPTRIMRIGIEGAEAAVIAVDGIAIPPVALSHWLMGPAMRCDLVVRSPRDGAVARLVDTSADARIELVQLAGRGPARRASSFDPAPLRAGRIPAPDLANAIPLAFRFQTSDSGSVVTGPVDLPGGDLGSLCLSSKTFWTINEKAWPDLSQPRLPQPLAVLQRGRTYLVTLRNDSVFSHPIHIHGHTLSVLRFSMQDRTEHHADTVLLLPGEEVQAAFVADNPGDWMFHCHVIEHQENGMMGYLRVA